MPADRLPVDPRDVWNIPGLWRRLFPGNTPTIREQLRCPEGYHRDLASGACVPNEARGPLPPITEPGTIVEVPTGPPAGAPPRPGLPRPPKVPGPVEPPSSPPPSSTGPSPVDRTTGRYFPRNARPLPNLVEAASTAGLVLWVLGTLVFAPYFRTARRYGPLGFPEAEPTGPPRRTRRPPGPASDVPPYYRYEGPWPYVPGTPLPGPFPLPRRTPNVPSPGGLVDPTTGAPLPAPRVRTVPRTRSPVSPLPAEWTLGSPLPGPGYDPFTRAPAPAPAPRAAPRTRPGRRTGPRVTFPLPFPWSVPGLAPGFVGDPLTGQPSPRPAPRTPTTPRPQLPPRPTLTTFDEPLPQSIAQPLRGPQKANPCTTERTARRRRQRECKEFTTKTIRVCADK